MSRRLPKVFSIKSHIRMASRESPPAWFSGKVCDAGVATEHFGPCEFNRGPDRGGDGSDRRIRSAWRGRRNIAIDCAGHRLLDQQATDGVAADLAARRARDFGNKKPALRNGLSAHPLKTPRLQDSGGLRPQRSSAE